MNFQDYMFIEPDSHRYSRISFGHPLIRNVKTGEKDFEIEIYSPSLACFFSSKTILIENFLIESNDENIKPIQIEWSSYSEDLYKYLMLFLNGFQKGTSFFKENFEISRDTLYDERKAKRYIQDLYHNLYVSSEYGFLPGWVFQIPFSDFSISDDILFKSGYYHGCISCVRKLIIRYPAIFADLKLEKKTIKQIFSMKSDSTSNAGSDEEKLITLNSSIIENVYRILIKYFDKESSDDLRKLLNGKKIERKLVFNERGNKLIDVFWCLSSISPKLINETKESIKQWIYNSFQYKGTNGVRDFGLGYIDRNLITQTRECKHPIAGIELLSESLKDFVAKKK